MDRDFLSKVLNQVQIPVPTVFIITAATVAVACGWEGPCFVWCDATSILLASVEDGGAGGNDDDDDNCALGAGESLLVSRLHAAKGWVAGMRRLRTIATIHLDRVRAAVVHFPICALLFVAADTRRSVSEPCTTFLNFFTRCQVPSGITCKHLCQPRRSCGTIFCAAISASACYCKYSVLCFPHKPNREHSQAGHETCILILRHKCLSDGMSMDNFEQQQQQHDLVEQRLINQQ